MEESIKINFLKKIWYSIARPSKYIELRKIGLIKALKYIIFLVCIFALILAIVASYIQIGIVNEAILYLDEKLPSFKFKDNKLVLDDAEVTILDDDKIISYLGNKIVINTSVEKNDAINKYKELATEKNKVLIFLDDEYVLISSNLNSENKETIENQKYADISSKYIKDSTYEYSKKDVIEYLKDRTTYAYYIAQYFIVYLLTILLLYFIYIILIAITIWGISKSSKFFNENSKSKLPKIISTIFAIVCTLFFLIKGNTVAIYILISYIAILIWKTEWNFKESIINTIYASTLSLIAYVLYMVLSYFVKFKIPFFDVICICMIFVYLFIIVLLQRSKNKDEKIKNDEKE